MIFENACVIGAGRAGQAIAARLDEHVPTRVVGRDLACAGAALVVLCVPDQAIAEVAAAVAPGPWLCHVSGATSLDALAPHERRFAVHPLMTFQAGLGPEQLDGAWGAIGGESPEAIAAGHALAELLGLRPFLLDEASRPLYHAAATTAAGFLATLGRAAARMAVTAGVPPQALVPLMQRVIDNGFAPTGPHVRGDLETIDLHLRVIQAQLPDLAPLYRALSEATDRELAR